MKKVLAVSIVLFLFVTALMPTLYSKTPDYKKTTSFFKNESKVSGTYFEASSSYDYGLKVGKRFRLQYKLLDILIGLTKKNKVNQKDISDQINVIERSCPLFLDELKIIILAEFIAFYI